MNQSVAVSRRSHRITFGEGLTRRAFTDFWARDCLCHDRFIKTSWRLSSSRGRDTDYATTETTTSGND
ncbi:MAG: hypothetical protein CMJ80_01840 [Planctomycetaceae bacterium]|nr:hypothetical protein [Planctomycetaceae bacterium]